MPILFTDTFKGVNIEAIGLHTIIFDAVYGTLILSSLLYTPDNTEHTIIKWFKIFAILKKGIETESEKVCKQVWYRNRFKIQLKCCFRMEINSKAFAITILTASSL